MKKLIVLAVLLLTVLAVAACGAKKTDEAATEEKAAVTEAEAPATEEAEAEVETAEEAVEPAEEAKEAEETAEEGEAEESASEETALADVSFKEAYAATLYIYTFDASENARFALGEGDAPVLYVYDDADTVSVFKADGGSVVRDDDADTADAPAYADAYAITAENIEKILAD